MEKNCVQWCSEGSVCVQVVMKLFVTSALEEFYSLSASSDILGQ